MTLSASGVAHSETPMDCVHRVAGLQFTSNVDGFSVRTISKEDAEKRLNVHRAFNYTVLLTKNGQNFSEQDLFNDKSDLIIGIDTEGNTQGHTYLIINDKRIDGRMFFALDTVIDEGWTLSKGILLRYKNVPQETKDRLVAWLNSGKTFRTATCVATGCRLLYEIAQFQNPPDHDYWFPSKLLKHIAQTGLVTKEGVPLTPEIYALNSDITSVWNNLPNAVKVPTFLFQVLFDPYTWAGSKHPNVKPLGK